MQEFLQWLGYGLCHQLPERSFFGGGLQVPVCARDTGIYVGFAVAMLVIVLVHRGHPTSIPPIRVTIVLAGLLALMGLDGITSYAGWRETTNELRLATGLGAGYALAAFTAPLLSGQLWRVRDPERVLGTAGAVAGFFGSLPLVFLVVRYVAPLLGQVYPLLVGVSILLTFTAVNLVVVCMLPPFEWKATRPRDVLVPALVALALGLLELSLATQVRLWMERLAQSIR